MTKKEQRESRRQYNIKKRVENTQNELEVMAQVKDEYNVLEPALRDKTREEIKSRKD